NNPQNTFLNTADWARNIGSSTTEDYDGANSKWGYTFGAGAGANRWASITTIASISDLSFEFKVISNSADPQFVMRFRFNDESGYTVDFNMGGANTPITLNRRDNVSATQLDIDSTKTLNVDTYYTFKITMIGDAIKVYFDGNLLLEATDSTYTEGNLGFFNYNADSGNNIYFDFLEIKVPFNYKDFS
ncbi:unnamed protein product, partial [marine sediment metagenome]